MKIGVCGTGKMGAAIAQRLMSCSHKITVWNRDPAKTQPLASLGANVAASPAALCQACDVIITMVLDDSALDAVYRGAAGILSADLSGRLVIDMSTVLPATEEAIAAEVKEKGAAFVECPVGGTVGPAREGKLFGLMGGGEADVARALAGQLPQAASFDVRAARKDLSTMVAYARTLGLDLPTAAAALKSFDEAAAQGLADKDAIAVPARWASGTMG